MITIMATMDWGLPLYQAWGCTLFTCIFTLDSHSQPPSFRASSWGSEKLMAGGSPGSSDENNWLDSCPLGKWLSFGDTSYQNRNMYLSSLVHISWGRHQWHLIASRAITFCFLSFISDYHGHKVNADACWFSNKMLWIHFQEGAAQNWCDWKLLKWQGVSMTGNFPELTHPGDFLGCTVCGGCG